MTVRQRNLTDGNGHLALQLLETTSVTLVENLDIIRPIAEAAKSPDLNPGKLREAKATQKLKSTWGQGYPGGS